MDSDEARLRFGFDKALFKWGRLKSPKRSKSVLGYNTITSSIILKYDW